MSKIFDGRAGEMRDSPWMASEDLDGLGDVKLTIKAVYEHRGVEFEAGRKKDRVWSLEFEGAKRQLVLNGTNRKSLVRLFGVKTSEWVGKQITLYIVKGVRVGRETKSGIRIRTETN